MFSSKRAYNWWISLVAAACMVLYGYDASVFNSVQGSKNWNAWFNKPDGNVLGSINTSYTVGAICGGFFFGGPLSDFAGRKTAMAVGCICVIIATFMQAFSPQGNIGPFIAGRVLIGIGQGIALTAGPIYIGELAPPQIRGKLMTYWQLFWSVGAFICFWVNYGCQLHVAALGEWDWRMVVIFQLLVPCLILCFLPTIPGSPRWFIKRGDQIEKARNALLTVREPEEVEKELLMIREAIAYENEAISSTYWALWRDKSVRKRLLLAFTINAGQQVTGQGTLTTYSTKIYQKVFTSSSQIALINALNATFGILFTLNAAWLVDRFGRKFMLIVGALGMGVCMIIVATVETQTPVLANGAKTESVGIATVFLLFLFIFFYKPSWGATVWIWTSEVFPMNVRAQAVGMAGQTQNICNAIVQQFFPIFLNNDGFYSFYMFAGINFLLAIFVYFMIPETKKVPLEEIDALFGSANHAEKGADLLGGRIDERVTVESAEKLDKAAHVSHQEIMPYTEASLQNAFPHCAK